MNEEMLNHLISVAEITHAARPLLDILSDPVVLVLLVVLACSIIVGYVSTKYARVYAEWDRTAADLATAQRRIEQLKAEDELRPVLPAEIAQGKHGRWRFTIRDHDGRSLAVATPTGWEHKHSAVDAVELLTHARFKIKD